MRNVELQERHREERKRNYRNMIHPVRDRLLKPDAQGQITLPVNRSGGSVEFSGGLWIDTVGDLDGSAHGKGRKSTKARYK